MSAVKRIQKQLSAPRRAIPGLKNASLHQRVEALKRGAGAGGDGAAVTVMGTGRAVEKTLAVAAWFEDKGEWVVEVRTGTVGAVDDVVVEEGEGEDESRVRKLSCLEVTIKPR